MSNIKKRFISLVLIGLVILVTVSGNVMILNSSSTIIPSAMPSPAEPHLQEIDLIDDLDNGKEVVVSMGQIIKVSLSKSSGNSWNMVQSPDKGILRESCSSFMQNSIPSIWIYDAVGEGSTVIECICTNGDIFKTTVKVKQPDGMLVVNSVNKGKEIVLKKGELFKVVLYENNCAYEWSCLKTPDESILKSGQEYEVLLPLEPIVAPTGGTKETYYRLYRAEGAGHTELTYTYASRSNKEATAVETITFSITVTDENSVTTTPTPKPTPKLHEIVSINEESNGKEIVVSMGQVIELTLNNSSGSSWGMDKRPDSSILSGCNNFNYYMKNGPSIWFYNTIGEGSTPIECRLSDGDKVKTFKVVVTVKQPDGLIVVTGTSDEKEIVLKKGEQFNLILYDEDFYNRWTYDQTDKSIVKEVSKHVLSIMPSVSYPVPTGGWSTNYYILFSAEQAGSTKIICKRGYTYYGEYESSKTFTLLITVKDDTSTFTPVPTPTLHGDNALYGFIKPDINSSKPDLVNKNIKIEVVETGAVTYTDSNGHFGIFPIVNMNECTLKITKDNYLTRTIKAKLNTSNGTEYNPIVIWPGDFKINGVQDNAINMADIMAIAKLFNKGSNDELFNPDYDLNMDSAINMADIMAITKHFNSVSNDYDNIYSNNNMK